MSKEAFFHGDDVAWEHDGFYGDFLFNAGPSAATLDDDITLVGAKGEVGIKE